MKRAPVVLILLCFGISLHAQKPLHQLQQEFIDLRFGLFIHFNIPTFSTDDWPDPEISDFGNDDNFKSSWVSNIHVKEP